MPLIAFGDGMFGKDGVKIKGHESGIVGILYRMLKRREARGEAVIVTIDEYSSSQSGKDLASQNHWSDQLQINPQLRMWDPKGFRFLRFKFVLIVVQFDAPNAN
ncbi:hypothetical protein VTP01DRAFT_7545 [Rhizomucor pusillus]|uniref:uncharacterized protein n=1 Tax=Rhizomucor pusillus TaxID=4840 RepID=UPI00374300FE